MHDMWHADHWLNDEEAKVFKRYGYYSKPMDFNPKFKVIVLNTNVAYDFNYRMLVNRYDPGGILKWFEGELVDLEKNGGFAYVVGHIPPMHYLYQFGVRYQALLERYQHIIHFSSFAHTHYESFFVDKAQLSRKPIHFGMVHGSVTTFVHRDPQFYLFEWDEEFMVPVNIHVYTMSI